MADVMAGKKPIEDLVEGVRSAIRAEIYREACRILEIKKEGRKEALEAVPAMIRPHIEAEVRRIWEMRR